MTTVTDADREAAASFLESWEPGPEMTVVKLSHAFARHREAEVAKIVAWLRDEVEAHPVTEYASFAAAIACSIEAGEYRNHG